MKSTLPWILSLLVANMTARLVSGEFFILSGPEDKFWSLYNAQYKEISCITDEEDSALIWNSNLLWMQPNYNQNIVNKSYILSDDKYVFPTHDYLNCHMSHIDPCSLSWNRTGKWRYVDSLIKPMAPVFDNRWEDFTEYELSETFNYYERLRNSGSLTVSLRGYTDAHFAVCDSSNSKDCFYIILGGWNNSQSVIRRCKNGIPEPAAAIPSDECAVKLVTVNHGAILSPIEWETFIIKWDFRNQKSIFIYNQYTEILGYTENLLEITRKPDDSQYLFYARSKSRMLMKLHHYGFSLTRTSQSKLISPVIMPAKPDRNICVKISVSLCKQCMVTVNFVNRTGGMYTGSTLTNKGWSDLHDLPVWKVLEINKKLPVGMREPVTLEINTFFTEGADKNNLYWAISNVRRCYNSQYLKVRKVRAHQDIHKNNTYFWPNLTCQKISADGDSKIIESTNQKHTSISAESRKTCPENTIGFHCSVPCSKLFSNNGDCKNLLTCDNDGCSCAPGFYKIPHCNDRCPVLSHGYDCAQSCGACIDDNCNSVTGACTYGCNNTHNTFFHPPYCKTRIDSPPAPTVELIDPTSVRVFLNPKNEYKTLKVNMSFEIWTNSILVVDQEIPILTNTVPVQTLVENLNPGTEYRARGIIHVGRNTLIGEWGNFTMLCLASQALHFITTVNETSITLINDADVHTKDACPDTWYRVQLFSNQDIIFDESTPFPKTFSGLKPFTSYNLIIKPHNPDIPNILENTITTLEGVPDAVEDLKVLNFTDKIDLKWRPPNQARGEIVNYTMKIELVELLGCNALNGSFSVNTSNDTHKFFKIHTVIANSSQNSFSHSFKGLKPYTKYLVTIYASTSRHQGIKIELYLTTKQTKFPTEVFTNLRLINKTSEKIAASLRWDPPSDCSTISGPIEASMVHIKRLGKLFMKRQTPFNYFDLKKSIFYGAETYEVHLYILRDLLNPKSLNASTSLIFTMPDRAPPPVRDAEIIEVDIINKSTTLRWEAPIPPINGKLEHYSIAFGSHNMNTFYDLVKTYFLHDFEECRYILNISDILCKTIALPDGDYNTIQIRAHNANVSEASKPFIIPIKTKEFAPSNPLDLRLDILRHENASINIFWKHPLVTGGRLKNFEIIADLIDTRLKSTPWEDESFKIYHNNVIEYRPHYSINLNLFPSSKFIIEVQATTIGGIKGKIISRELALPDLVKFDVENLRAKSNNDQMISIKIPNVIYDIKTSVMVVLVQGPKHCDEEELNSNEDVNLFLNLQNVSYYKTAWKAATLMNPKSYADKVFKIGDGNKYGGSKNYALCPKESYLVHLVLVDNIQNLTENKFRLLGNRILKTTKTEAIYIGELPKNYVAWLTPFFFIVLIVVLLAFIIYRKKLTNRFITNKPKTNQENMPLAHDYSTKKLNNSIEVEAGTKVTIPNNNLIIVDKKSEFLMPVKVEEFGSYFQTAFKSKALEKEYSSIKSGLTRPSSYGSRPETRPKNRYANLFPYDDTRVVLEKLPDEPYSDYINANYITGYGGKKKAYIATQGPKPNTVIDFWRMIWQEKVEIICMMANLVENEQVKCEQYWPAAIGKKILYGAISVHFFSEEVHSDYTCRTFKASYEDQETRTIEHLHYTVWPDHGVPSDPRSIVVFLKEIQKHSSVPRKADSPPIVVHCSAGIGRTGTLIVLDMSICRALTEKVIDVYANLSAVRNERLNMVGNTDQYLLVHLVLVEYLNSNDTCFTCDTSLSGKLEEAKQNSLSHYQRILDTSWHNEVLGPPSLPKKSLSNRNIEKTRFPESAGGINRLYLKRLVTSDEDSDYIAATCVRRLLKNCQYITTQLPMPSTNADFWRMLSEQNVEYVLVLQLPNLQNPTYCELLPESQEFGSTKYLKIIRLGNSTIDSKYYVQEEVLIIDSSEQPSKEHFIKIISYKNWLESSLPSPSELVNLWTYFEEFPKNEKCPVVIACHNGVTASGLWLAISCLLKRMVVDKECDVLQAVRAVRRCREDFFDKPEYLEYLYNVALEWSKDSEDS